MLTTILKGRVARASAGFAAAALVAGTTIMGGTPVGADPKQFAAMTAVGSDTTQDVLNAFAGFNNGINYTPQQSSSTSGLRQVVSWDAIGTDCITTKAGTAPAGPTFLRPNGSTNGRRALSRAIDGGTFPASTTLCGGPKAMSGQVDFARSSAGPATLGNDLVYIPFGRDALSFAYYMSSGTPLTTLTSAQLTSLFTSGPQNIGGVDMIPCGIQLGSGTYASWNTALGVTQATETAATLACTTAGNGLRVQENDATGLKAKGDAQPGKQVIIGFSAANFIAQSNGVAASQLATGVDLGSIDSLGKPYTGTAPNLVASPTFYASTVYGRDVYNVVSRLRVEGLGNADFKSMFVGAAATLCLSPAQSITQAFGFSFPPVLACGATTLRGTLVANV